MKKIGVINREISQVLARMGHTDTIVIADCGLPIPDQVKRI
jgi:D-ribose pyranase